jgi:hypothetical protein
MSVACGNVKTQREKESKMLTHKVDGIEYAVREILGRYDVRPAAPHSRRTVLFTEQVVEREGSILAAVEHSVRWALAVNR